MRGFSFRGVGLAHCKTSQLAQQHRPTRVIAWPPVANYRTRRPVKLRWRPRQWPSSSNRRRQEAHLHVESLLGVTRIKTVNKTDANDAEGLAHLVPAMRLE
jgi:hypothetical protein